MKTKALEELIEHCKHIGGVPAIFLKDRIIAAEEELQSINRSLSISFRASSNVYGGGKVGGVSIIYLVPYVHLPD